MFRNGVTCYMYANLRVSRWVKWTPADICWDRSSIKICSAGLCTCRRLATTPCWSLTRSRIAFSCWTPNRVTSLLPAALNSSCAVQLNYATTSLRRSFTSSGTASVGPNLRAGGRRTRIASSLIASSRYSVYGEKLIRRYDSCKEAHRTAYIIVSHISVLSSSESSNHTHFQLYQTVCIFATSHISQNFFHFRSLFYSRIY